MLQKTAKQEGVGRVSPPTRGLGGLSKEKREVGSTEHAVESS